MKNNITFTIVTPNYNMGEYLEETIKSVLSNLRPGDKYFIVDGGSTDNSIDVIKKYESRLTGWVSEPDSGYSEALKKGFLNSSTTHMCWINSGDIFLRGAFEIARKLLSDTKVDMIFGDDVYFSEDGLVIQVTNGSASDLKKMMLYGSWTPLQDSCFWSKSLYDLVGGIDSSKLNAADYDLFLRMSMNGNCKYFPYFLSGFRQHFGQKSIKNRTGYKSEVNLSRKIQLEEDNNFFKKFLLVIFWFKVRLHVRINVRKKSIPDVVGCHVNNIIAKLIKS